MMYSDIDPSFNDTQDQRDIGLPGVGKEDETDAELLSNIIISRVESPDIPFANQTRVKGAFLIFLAMAGLIFLRIGIDNGPYLLGVYVSLIIVVIALYKNKRDLERTNMLAISIFIFYFLMTLGQNKSRGLVAFSALMLTLLLFRLAYIMKQPLLVFPLLFAFIYLCSLLYYDITQGVFFWDFKIGTS